MSCEVNPIYLLSLKQITNFRINSSCAQDEGTFVRAATQGLLCFLSKVWMFFNVTSALRVTTSSASSTRVQSAFDFKKEMMQKRTLQLIKHPLQFSLFQHIIKVDNNFHAIIWLS